MFSIRTRKGAPKGAPTLGRKGSLANGDPAMRGVPTQIRIGIGFGGARLHRGLDIFRNLHPIAVEGEANSRARLFGIILHENLYRLVLREARSARLARSARRLCLAIRLS